MVNGKYIAACLLLLAGLSARAQAPFTVLSNNSDLGNNKLYVEIMYEKPSCGDGQAKFRLVTKSNPAGVSIAIDSVLNNPNTYEISADKKSLIRPQAGGYKLTFRLPAGTTSADSAHICVDSYQMAYRCKGCGAAGSDALFAPENIRSGCPYNNSNGDLLACYRRTSTEANWEAWIQDPRDCQPYRVVMMPDGKWWFAQNLNYTKDLTDNESSTNGGVTNAPVLGTYWCPGGAAVPSVSAPNYSITTVSGGAAACKTYGALYAWNTAMSLNGRSTQSSPVATGQPSSAQGVCPYGWSLPSDYDWSVLYNAVEDCASPTSFGQAAPCNHLYNDNTSSGWYGGASSKVAPSLKSPASARPHTAFSASGNAYADTIVATATNPAWTWSRADYTGKIAAHVALGNDKYGFSVLPSGYRVPSGTAASCNFQYMGNLDYYWTSTQYDGNTGFYSGLYYDRVTSVRSWINKAYGFSVRCAKNATVGITYVTNASGTNGASVSVAAVAVPETTIEWYDAPTGGTLLGNGSSYTTTTPITVYVQSRSADGLSVSKPRIAVSVTYTYTYTGAFQTINLPKGSYKFEVWGAQGGSIGGAGGLGGYSTGIISNPTLATSYVYVGQQPGGNVGGWNGGGNGGSTSDGQYRGGGGATDIRIGGNTLNHRVIVAGGGAGGHNYYSVAVPGGAGGGTTGGAGTYSQCSASYPGPGNALGGSQTAGGAGSSINGTCQGAGPNGAFGTGGSQTGSYGSGGGGGWYGGGGGSCNSCAVSSGAGGSGYVLTSTSARPSGYIHAVGSPYQMSSTSTSSGVRSGHGQVVITPQ